MVNDIFQNLVNAKVREISQQLENEIAKYSAASGIPFEELELIHIVGTSVFHAKEPFKFEQEYIIRRRDSPPDRVTNGSES